MLCDKESPVLDQLANKAKTVKYNKQIKGENKRYFDGTIDLVFRNRKAQYLSQQKRKVDDDITELVAEKVNQIMLKSFY